MNEGKELQLVSFGNTSAKEVLAKLHREIDRINAAPKTEFVADHVMNAFWTAWHMHVWIWEAVKDQPALRGAVLKYRGIEEENIEDASAFGTALARRFVPLKICRKIAIGGRHVHVVGSTDASGLDGGDVTGRRAGDADNKSARGSSADVQNGPTVIVMGRAVSVLQLLREVEDYWVTLVHENGVEQLR